MYHPRLPQRSAARTELRRRSFDSIAGLYHSVRPTYPESLIDDAVRLSGIPVRGSILEIGPGPGEATLLFARRGFRILGLEIGARLSRLCRRNLREFPGVEIRNVAFEDWQPEVDGHYDMVLAASAFHWIPGQIAYRRSARFLRDSGSLALLWNFRHAPEPELHKGMQEIYRRHAPHLARVREPRDRIARQEKKIVSSGLFGPVIVRTVDNPVRYTADEYVALMCTMSDHAILAPDVRRRIFAELRRLIDRHGGSFTRQVTSVLFLARRR
jgi:SAM-dependent methyltransferase